MNSFECFYTRDMPSIFHLEYPVGTVLGQAKFSDYLVVYQGVSVGGDLKLRYPQLGEGIALFSKCSLIGNVCVGSNCAIGAGVQLYGENVPCNVSVSSRGPSGFVSSPLSWSVLDRFLRYE